MSIDQLVMALVYLVVVGLIAWVLFWGLSQIALPEPFAKVAKVLLVLFVVLVVVAVLLSLIGHPLVHP